MATRSSLAATLQLRLAVHNPVVGVVHALQSGKDGRVGAVVAAVEDEVLRFELAVQLRAAADGVDGAVDFSGAFVQGPRGDRFVYLNTGRRAGQHHLVWERRAKLKLGTLGSALLARAWAGEAGWAQAAFAGRARDGGPLCATVQPLGEGWVWVEGAL